MFFFFFFQAEDGIRDLTVTGVQTCALPISCWDYHLRLPEFLGWIARRERAGSVVWNRADLLRWNCHKGYLRDLAARDVATVPTRWLARGEEIDLRALLADAAWQDAVVKPAVSASASGT